MARIEAEFSRTNVTVGQFLSYVRAQLKKRGLDEWAGNLDYDNFIADNGVDGKVDHKAKNDEVYALYGIELEIVRDRPYNKQTFEKRANGKVYNEIIEFAFDSERTGHGYYYLTDSGAEDEVESVESTADETTVAESESVDNDENNSCGERAATSQTTKGADNLNNREKEYNMTERITTARGTFRVASQSREELEALGYGYYCEAGDGEHIIMGNGTRALAVRIQPEPAAEPETNTTATDTAESEAEAEAESESVESVDNTENGVCGASESTAINELNGDAENPTTAREEHIMNAFEALRWANITKGFKAIPLHGVNVDDRITAALEAVQGRCKARTIDADDIKNAIAQMEGFFGIPKCKLDGLRIDCDVNAQNFPNAYRFVPESTIFSAENRKGKWYITSIRRAPTYAPTRAVQVCHMPEAMEEAIIARHSKFGI